MSNELFNPRKKKILGVDIADHTIEIVELFKSGRGIRASAFSRSSIPEETVENGRLVNRDALISVLRETVSKAKPFPVGAEEAVFGLPESQVYYHGYETARGLDSDKDIRQEAAALFPLEEGDIELCYRKKNIGKNRIKIDMFATSRKLIAEWTDFFHAAGYEIRLLDLENLALRRAINSKPPFFLLDIGKERSSLTVFGREGIDFSCSFKIGGNAVTRRLAEVKKIGFEKAEEFKIKYGLLSGDEACNSAAREVLSALVSEIKVCATYVKGKYGQRKDYPDKIILSGGTSQLKGILEFFRKSLGGDFKTEAAENRYIADDKLYLEAAGLALRRLDGKFADDPFFPVKQESLAERFSYPNHINFRNMMKRFFLFPAAAVVLIVLFFSFFLKKGDVSDAGYRHTYSVIAEIPVDIEEPVDSGSIKGRTISIKAGEAGEYEKAVAEALEAAGREIGFDEAVWRVPLNEIDYTTSGLVYPHVFEFLVYSQNIESLFQEKIREILANDDILLSRTEVVGAKTKDGLLLLEAKGDFLLKDQPVKKELTAVPPDVTEEKEKPTKTIRIKQLTSRLNVRMGPGNNYKIITGAEPGNEYQVIAEQDGWYKITIHGVEGWISAPFTDDVATDR